MKAVIISGGSIDGRFALPYIRQYQPDYILAADRGLQFLAANDIKADLIVGDFDSLPDGIIEAYLKKYQVPVRKFNPVKDYTDTEIALRAAIEAGATKLVLIGGTGTRLDHCIGNMQCLHILLDAGIQAAIVDPCNRITLHETGFTIEKETQFGKYVSFIPAGETVTGLNLTGFKYELCDRTITNADSLTISNEITADKACVSFASGRLFMIESRDTF